MKTSTIARRLVRAVAIVLGLALLTLGGTAIANETTPASIAQQADSTTPAATNSAQKDDANYAERERAEFSKELADFQGGDTVIIGTSAVGVVLLVLILVVLL